MILTNARLNPNLEILIRQVVRRTKQFLNINAQDSNLSLELFAEKISEMNFSSIHENLISLCIKDFRENLSIGICLGFRALNLKFYSIGL
jgi:hypothetical protein